MKTVSIVIPVYNAFELASKCIRSVINSTGSEVLIVVVDDASPDGRFNEYLSTHGITDTRINYLRNVKNLGFVASCNIGISKNPADDVVLLNSDTEVADGWLVNLQAAAYSRANVGTVTPLTNNGTVCSFPKFMEDNELPSLLSATDLARIVSKVSVREYPEIPTAVGFCMYIKRELISKIGLLDEESFGVGYGEENDFCCRGRAAGYIDILDDATFVYHKGSASFGENKLELVKNNEETLRKRYPHFYPSVAKFCAGKPLRNIHRRILDELTREYGARTQATVLHILHNGPFKEWAHGIGGTELHVQDLITNSKDIFHWTLVPLRDGYVLSAHFGDFERQIRFNRDELDLGKLLTRTNFDLIHVHHTNGFVAGDLVCYLANHGNYVVSIHDYHWLCPRIYMVTPKAVACTGRECVDECRYKLGEIAERRNQSFEIFERARRVVIFSESSRKILSNLIGPRVTWELQPHGMAEANCKRTEAIDRPSEKNPLRLAFVGRLLDHKGGRIVDEITKLTAVGLGGLGGVEINWHVIGKLYNGALSNVTEHGEYERGGLAPVLKKINPHLVILPYICPETYSVTLDEVWNSGIPVVVTPIGAPAERVNASGAGYVLGEASATALSAMIGSVVENWSDYLIKRSAATKIKLRTVVDEASSYTNLYRSLVIERNASAQEAISLLSPFMERKESFGFRDLLARILSELFSLIERAGLRKFVKDLAYAVLPRKAIESLMRWKKI